MAAKEKLKFRAARAGEELRRTGKLVLRAPALVRFAECVIRLLLGALLAGAEIFGGYAPFGVGLVACSGSGLDGFCALAGACFGYLSFQGFAGGLRYVAASILVYSISFAFFDLKAYRRGWFMPAAAACMNAITGFVYLSDRGWTAGNLIFFATEVLLAGASAYFYRLAFSPWTEKREEEPLSPRQVVSLLILGGTLLITLSGITVFKDLSLGRAAAAVMVLTVACKAGMGPGAAAGVAAGVGMDLAAGGTPFYAMSYAFAGVMSGIFHRQGRLASAVAYVLSNALAVLWTWGDGPRISSLYEVFIASVIFLLLPDRLLRRAGALLTREPQTETDQRARRYVKGRLEEAAGAFRSLHESLRGAISPAANDNDAATVFDRAADRVCRRCPLQSACWQRDYVSTYNALNDALPAMLERGKGEAGDFPAWFSSKCMKFPAFLAAANEELVGLLYRRQYRSRLRENREAVCRQYGALAERLGSAAAELGAELAPDPVREKRILRHLLAKGIEARAAAYYDEGGHLRVELWGGNFAALRSEEAIRDLSEAAGISLRLTGEEEPLRRDRLTLVQREPLMAVAGVAAAKREGETVSGDTGAWFKSDDGALYVLLCDGMGSGARAGQESSLAVNLLEQFLRAGVPAERAMETVAEALGLRNEEEGGFTTVDLLRVDLFTGETGVYKYGAAPTYVKRGGQVSRVTGSSLPAGLSGQPGSPDVTRLTLSAGDCVLLVSDGVSAGESDLWIRERLAAFDGTSPRELAGALIEESGTRGGAVDDRTALVLRLSARAEDGAPAPRRDAEKRPEKV